MARFTVTVDFAPLFSAIDRIFLSGLRPESLASLLPNTLTRIGDLAQEGERRWKQRATKLPGQEGRPLRLGTGAGDPMVRLDRSSYTQNINTVSNPDDQGLSYSIIAHDRQAPSIEDGTPGDQHPIDLHRVLPYAPKGRRSKKGNLYLRIPFRHATTEPGTSRGHRFQGEAARFGHGVLPSSVTRLMATKRPHHIVGRYTEPSATVPGVSVQRFRYSKNPGRLTMGEIETLNKRARKHPISQEYARNIRGLIRTGAKGHGQYLSIRTLSEANPEGWRIKPYPPQRVGEKVTKELGTLAEQNWFDEAMRADAEHLAAMAQEGTT